MGSGLLFATLALSLAGGGNPAHNEADRLADEPPGTAGGAPAEATVQGGDPADGGACLPPAPGFLTVATHPWTVVYVDGELAGTTPLFKFLLPAGSHTLRFVNAARGIEVEEVVEIDEGSTRKLSYILALQGAPPQTLLDGKHHSMPTEEECLEASIGDPAFVSVNTHPWAKVFLDGKLIGSTPVFRHKITPGTHTLRLQVGDEERLLFTRFEAAPLESVKIVLGGASGGP